MLMSWPQFAPSVALCVTVFPVFLEDVYRKVAGKISSFDLYSPGNSACVRVLRSRAAYSPWCLCVSAISSVRIVLRRLVITLPSNDVIYIII